MLCYWQNCSSQYFVILYRTNRGHWIHYHSSTGPSCPQCFPALWLEAEGPAAHTQCCQTLCLRPSLTIVLADRFWQKSLNFSSTHKTLKYTHKLHPSPNGNISDFIILECKSLIDMSSTVKLHAPL